MQNIEVNAGLRGGAQPSFRLMSLASGGAALADTRQVRGITRQRPRRHLPHKFAQARLSLWRSAGAADEACLMLGRGRRAGARDRDRQHAAHVLERSESRLGEGVRRHVDRCAIYFGGFKVGERGDRQQDVA